MIQPGRVSHDKKYSPVHPAIMTIPLTYLSLTSTAYYPVGALTTIFTPPSYCNSLIDHKFDVLCDFNNYATYYSGCLPNYVDPSGGRPLLYSQR
jgi:hypothetical protein